MNTKQLKNQAQVTHQTQVRAWAKCLISALFLIFLPFGAYCQIVIAGQVSCEDEGPLPGVNVIEKGTYNNAITDINGNYSITVKDSSSILSFSYVGYLTRDVPTHGQRQLDTILKMDAIYEKWDQKIRLYLASGLIENPAGGKFEFLAPVFKSELSFQSNFSYQTNFSENHFLMGGLGLYNIRIGGYPGVGFKIDTDYRNISSASSFKLDGFSVETTWGPLYYFHLILGYGHYNLKQNELSETLINNGIMVGTEIWIPKPFRMSVMGKATLCKDVIEYQAEINKTFRRIVAFVRYYNAESFTELSIGLGYEFTYSFKYQKPKY